MSNSPTLTPKKSRRPARPRQPPTAPAADSLVWNHLPTVQRLYRISCRHYVQYGGEGELPPEVERFTEDHGGQPPPYMPLPAGPVEFDLGALRPVPWDGQAQLPEEVVAYVIEHGTLPRNSAERSGAEDGDDVTEHVE